MGAYEDAMEQLNVLDGHIDVLTAVLRLLQPLETAAEDNCYGSSALCTCSPVTEVWEAVEPVLRRKEITAALQEVVRDNLKPGQRR